MPVLIALILLFSPPPAQAETLRVGVTIAADLAGSVPGIGALQAGVGTLFAMEYGRFADIWFDAPSGAEVAAAGVASAHKAKTADATKSDSIMTDPSKPDATAKVALSRQAGAIDVSTDFTRGGLTRTLSSTVPAGAPASLVSTIAGDLSFLLFSSRDFSAFPLASPPSMLATLQTDTLQTLTGWDTTELEPIGLTESDGQVTICFPHRFLTLGHLFRITEDTIRDINGQASGPEPLQLSGIAAGHGGELLLLSESEGGIVRVNPRLGTRQPVAAPGLPALGARMLDADAVAVLSNTDGSARIMVYGLSPSGRRQLPVLASYASALALDGEGNLWVWDAGERRIRILTSAGKEVFSIRPLINASIMQLPQQLEVFENGSFLLGGSAEVWKFDNTGIPVWRLTRVPGRPGEQLPASFALVAHGADGAFTLLDSQSRRLMTFGANPEAGSSDSLSSLLARLDGRRLADLEEAGGLARDGGFSLMAWQFGDLLARRGGIESGRAEAGRTILREKSALYVELADSLARELLYERADGAYLRAAEAARALTAAAPDDDSAARLLENIVSRRQEVRAGLSRQSDVRIVSAAAGVAREGSCARSLTVMLRVRNSGPSNLTRVRVHICLPSIAAAQALAAIDTFFPGDERDVEVRLHLEGPLSSSALEPRGVPAALLVTYERGEEGFSAPESLTIQLADVGRGEALANSLSCRAETGDQLVAGLADDLLDTAGVQGGRADPVASLAGIMDSLGGLRRQAAPYDAGSDHDASPSPTGAAGGVRPSLRALTPDENDWTLLSVSVALGLGLPAGLISWPDRVLALVDTGIPLSRALSALNGPARYAAVLSSLSRNGRLCVPLSGRLSAGTSAATFWALVDALELCWEKGVGNATISWLDLAVLGARARPSAPVSFPFVLPSIPVRPSGEALRALIIKGLEQQQ